MTKKDPFQPANTEARTMAHDLLQSSTHAALAVHRADHPAPSVTRVALALDEAGGPVSLISQLAPHTHALAANPNCALLVGDPGTKGDPLTHPRLTLHCSALIVERDSPDHDPLRAHYLSQRPKAKLYVDFPDFRFVHFQITDGLLNGGFGKAFIMSPEDLI